MKPLIIDPLHNNYEAGWILNYTQSKMRASGSVKLGEFKLIESTDSIIAVHIVVFTSAHEG